MLLNDTAMKISEINPITIKKLSAKVEARIAQEAEQKLILYPDGNLVRRHLSCASTFCRAVVGMGYLSQQQMERAALRYRLGMSRNGGVIFWQISPSGHIYDGKIMYYQSNCHRSHSQPPTWVMAQLKAFYLADQPELAAELTPQHCLFGWHLLAGDEGTPVAVVEAEKTAVIMSEIYPQYLWLATGGLNELTPEKLFTLRGHRVILFPDTDEHLQAYTAWYKVSRQAEFMNGQPIHLSNLLERQASAEQKQRKIDLVDFYFENQLNGR